MDSGSVVKKVIFIIALFLLLILIIFFATNRGNMQEDLKNMEVISSMNADTYDKDLYVYKIDDNAIYASEYFYNTYFLNTNQVSFDEIKIDSDSKFYIKNLSNSSADINSVKVSYDPITKEEFEFLLDNYTLLKINVWLDENDKCDNVLLYSSGGVTLEVGGL